MQILVADDDPVNRLLLEQTLEIWGYTVRNAVDGEDAWRILQEPDAPQLAILDWMMPRLSGPDLCRRIRADERLRSLYIILLTARQTAKDMITGLNAGADDYLTKPFNPSELEARIGVGQRVVRLQRELAERIDELEHALEQVRTLSGLVPICAYCKKVRNEREYWERVESYISARSGARFSHGICPDCLRRVEEENGL